MVPTEQQAICPKGAPLQETRTEQRGRVLTPSGPVRDPESATRWLAGLGLVTLSLCTGFLRFRTAIAVAGGPPVRTK